MKCPNCGKQAKLDLPGVEAMLCPDCAEEEEAQEWEDQNSWTYEVNAWRKRVPKKAIASKPKYIRPAHSGDPCMFCGTPHDDVAIGDCVSIEGWTSEARKLADIAIHEHEGTLAALGAIFANASALEETASTPQPALIRIADAAIIAIHRAFVESE